MSACGPTSRSRKCASIRRFCTSVHRFDTLITRRSSVRIRPPLPIKTPGGREASGRFVYRGCPARLGCDYDPPASGGCSGCPWPRSTECVNHSVKLCSKVSGPERPGM